MAGNHNHCNNEASHDHACGNVREEVIAHFPYAVFSVALGLIGAALLDCLSSGAKQPEVVKHSMHTLFHTFHFMHIVFAATGGMLTYFRYSKNILKGILTCSVSTIVFCMLSDILLPYTMGTLFGVPMKLHICFVSEFYNVIPFLLIGTFNGWILAQHEKHLHNFYSLWSHFTHIFVSASAAIIYTISHGFTNWASHMGMIFLLLVIAVVIPCTLSDVVIPLFFAKDNKC